MRAVAALGTAALAAGTLAFAAPAGAVPRKLTPSTDPCTVLTDADLAGLSTSYSIASSTSELEHDCTVTLDDGSGPTLLDVTVVPPIGYRAQKAVAKKVKKVSGLPGGYTGTVNQHAEAAYNSGKVGVLLQSSDVSSADMVKILKALHQRLG
jgi:hypothetical protein